VPCCATPPPLITKILSAFRTVLRRCAMTRVVRLCSAIRRSMAACRFQGSGFRAWGWGSGVGGWGILSSPAIRRSMAGQIMQDMPWYSASSTLPIPLNAKVGANFLISESPEGEFMAADLNEGLALAVQGGSRLVEDEHLGALHQGPRYRYPLLLPPAQTHPPLPNCHEKNQQK
jgi:hypothetical protein